jgi:spermidine/putrescine transport system ATP-binding protein/putrescine transport system ATP-binding protein
MNQTSPLISIRNVSKRFGTYEAVKDVSIDIRAGEFFSLLGASGSGKTTLLRMIAGFEEASEGEIYIDGQPMTMVPPYRRPINMVFQNYAIFPHLNVQDNIAYGLRKMGLSRSERMARVSEMLDLVQLPGYGTRRAHELSGGQRQRVALARALILQPKVLLLDEPLGALDKQLRDQMQVELRRLQKAVGITFVFVTHDQEEALTLSDRIGVMEDGRVLQVDSPGDLYERPRSRRVAAFIGKTNLLDARVVSRRNDRVTVEIDSLGKFDLPANAVSGPVGASVCVSIRPEKFAIHDSPPARHQHVLKGEVAAAKYLGERSHLTISVPGCQTPLLVSEQNATTAGARHFVEGRPVWLTWRNDALVVMDPD